MNSLRSIMSSILLTALTIPAIAQEGRVTVRVTDFDAGVVVTNAEVRAGFNTNINPGWGWGGGRPNEEIGLTDTNGVCTLTGSGNGGSVGIAVGKEGYYWSSGSSVRFTNLTGVVGTKKWQPWDATVNVLIKRIGNPVPLYAKCIRDMEMPLENEPVGFDLVAGDWVSPHGEGKKPDIFFQMDRKPERMVPIKKIGRYGSDNITIHDVTLTVRGSSEGEGFYLIPMTAIGHGPASCLRMPHEAPVNGYETSVVKRAFNSVDEPSHTDVRDDANYFFRVRTAKDENGNIVSALYGKITGDFRFAPHIRKKLSFTYYLNPEPNDRNLEFDPRKNLFQNLSSLEEVWDP